MCGKEVGEIMGFLSGIFNKKEENSAEQELFASFLQENPPCGELQKPESEFLKMASKVVPAELIGFWQQYGFGSYGEGIIKVVNPTDYMGSLYMWLGKADITKIPIMVTAFGDIIYYRRLSETEDDVCMLNIHYRKVEVLAYSFKNFWQKTVTDKKVMKQLLYHDLYKQAVHERGRLQKNEIFFFVPALILGGKQTIGNVDKGDAVTHMHLLFNLGDNKMKRTRDGFLTCGVQGKFNTLCGVRCIPVNGTYYILEGCIADGYRALIVPTELLNSAIMAVDVTAICEYIEIESCKRFYKEDGSGYRNRFATADGYTAVKDEELIKSIRMQAAFRGISGDYIY